MGTYYGLGLAEGFIATARKDIRAEDWTSLLSKRLDLDLFELSLEATEVKGALRDGLFEANIEGLYATLLEMTAHPGVSFYLDEYGTDIAAYPRETMRLSWKDTTHGPIRLNLDCVLLYIEGKVLAEVFSFEPKLCNWLFRNSPLENPLRGAIFSDIVG